MDTTTTSRKQPLIAAVEYALSQDHTTRGLVVVALSYPVPVTQLHPEAEPCGRAYQSAQEGRVSFYARHGQLAPAWAYTEQGTLLTLAQGRR